MLFKFLNKERLIENGVSEKLADVLTNPKDVHDELDILIRKTYVDYRIPDDVSDVVPLWDCNTDSFCRWNRLDRIEYVKLDHDLGEWALIARSEQGVMAELYEKWWAFQDTGDDYQDARSCKQLAMAMGFKYQKEADEILFKYWPDYSDWVISLEN